ncbi:hypothetical protein [Thioalkalivibrio sp. HL-Eb18]|uniref:hypothetical protein n=1 Tax=Thioalkalivibrio sp. HL-Eb18 TaxID=1266913 RepID=UPI0003803374|nr:hypothetical protein [Thioalkalivibrio sp. HL-Eb18]
MPETPFARARCDACIYWHRLSTNEGSCRRHPPGLLQPVGESDGPFPLTKAIHWCGEWTHPDEAS